MLLRKKEEKHVTLNVRFLRILDSTIGMGCVLDVGGLLGWAYSQGMITKLGTLCNIRQGNFYAYAVLNQNWPGGKPSALRNAAMHSFFKCLGQIH